MKKIEFLQVPFCPGLELTQEGFWRNQQVVAEMNRMEKTRRGGWVHIREPLEELSGSCFENSLMFDSLPSEEDNN